MGSPLSPRPRLLARVALRAATLACACAAAGCMTPRVLALARGDKTESYRAKIESVTRAARRESGALVVCVETLTTLDTRDQVHVDVPLDKLAGLRESKQLEFARDAGFDSAASKDTAALRYVFFAAALQPGCPEAAKQVPVRTAAMDGSSEAGIYATPGEQGLAIRYHSAEPLWSSVRDVDLAPVLGGERVVPGSPRPIYYAALPFALLFDGLLGFLFVSQ